MDKKFLIVLGVVLIGLFGLFFFTKNDNNNSTAGNSASGQVSNHSIGQNAKNVELLVYGDFQCSVCAQFFPIEQQIIEKYKNDIKFTFRHFPLDTTHPNARAAHRAAEAAGKQNKFFNMHDLLYENQAEWSEQTNPKPIFEQYAKQLSLNINQFNTDYASETVNSTINADKNEGMSKDVQGTPTYFLNGNKLDNNVMTSLEAFSKKVDEYINK